jgi:hypothetical protein
MITGNIGNLENDIDFSKLGIVFSSKPIIHGGTAMEYYGLRKRGKDIDFVIANEDYQALAKKYPNNKKDMWGDLGVLVGEYELFRSVYRFDYDFYSEGAVEYDRFKIISFERLFFLKALSFKCQPEVLKLTNDFELMVKYYNDTFRNKDYVENAMKHIKSYESAPNGTIYNDKY